MRENLINVAYLIAAILFIQGMKGLSHPRKAVAGNQLASVGMLIAIVATLFDHQIIEWPYIVAGIVIGSVIGYLMAVRTALTGMPQMVALLNGFGGASSVLVAGAYLYEQVAKLHPAIEPVPGVTLIVEQQADLGLQMMIATALSGLIGAVTFWGSFIAWAKLQGVLGESLNNFPGKSALNVLCGAGALVLGVLVVMYPENLALYWALVGVCSVLGVTLVIGIGGADMPVAIALLNSYSGLAAAATGFVLSNTALIISGALVGASGVILTVIMCKAMNRSLMNVLLGGMGAAAEKGPSADDVYKGKIKSTTAEEIALMLDGISRFVVVPGYGMAVAQAQHAVRDLTNLLEAKGVTCEYAIHPVAGRMPGHMNVLLAEADIPYDKLKTMEEINPTFAQADVVMVVGANDVVNPEARTNPKSPIAGMPILDVDMARQVIVVKRSLSPGYAGIPNPLFAMPNTLMYFADGKKAILDIVAAIKAG